MATWVDLAALHNPAQGQRPPASWGDGINSNFAFLGGASAAEILTSQTTTSAAYVDLATVGPTVTVDTGARAVAFVQAQLSGAAAADTRMSVAVSGASSIAANDDQILWIANAAGVGLAASAMLLWTTLTPGTNIFTCKYYVAGGGTGTWLRRRLLVIPLV